MENELKKIITMMLSQCQGYDGLTRMDIDEYIQEWKEYESRR